MERGTFFVNQYQAEAGWVHGVGWGEFSTPDEIWQLWQDPEWRPWADDFMSQLPWGGTGVDVDADLLAEACARYCLAIVGEALPVGLIGKFLWKGGRYVGPFAKAFGKPLARRFGPRILSRQAKRTLAKRFEGLVKRGDEVRPVIRGTAGSGAQVLRASQYVALGDALSESFRADPVDVAKKLVEKIQRRAGERPDFDEFIDLEHRYEDDMPYNRRTGEWYPERRRYGYSNGRNRRRSYSRSNSNGGYAARRRRTYRRWY